MDSSPIRYLKEITFLFAEKVKVPSVWASEPEAAALSVTYLNQALSKVFAASGGKVLKSVEGGFCVAYERPMDAAKAALKIHSKLAAMAWPEVVIASGVAKLRPEVRIALFQGPDEPFVDDFLGKSASRAVRLAEIGHGGQILANSTFVESTSKSNAVSYIDLGFHRLRDLMAPLQVYQLAARGLPTEFPPLSSLSFSEANLPEQVSRFVSRGTELAICKDLLRKRRLLTLVGFGGIGKTRLACQVAAEIAAEFPHGVTFVDFAAIRQATAIAPAMCIVMGVSFTSKVGALDALTQALKQRPRLLVLDTCEHLAAAIGDIVEHLIRSVPDLKVLVTSRVPLGTNGEQRYRVSSLSLPAPEDAIGSIALTGAVQLFLDRARNIQPTFSLTPEATAAIVEICRRLDGIPLALELAAAGLKNQTSEQLLERLVSALPTQAHEPTGTEHDEPLHAAIEWSIDLLSEREKIVFRRLSVFGSSWSSGAAEAVAADSDIDPIDVLDGLHSLVEKSLIVYNGEDRYSWLQTIRDFSRKLLASSDEEDAIRRQHLMYCSRHLRHESGVTRSDSQDIKSEVDRELQDLFTAIEFAYSTGKSESAEDQQLALALTNWLFPYWNLVGRLSEGVRVGVEVLTQVGEHPSPDFIRLLIETGGAAYSVLDYALAEALLERAEKTSDMLGLASLSTEALRTRGEAAVHEGRLTDARSLLQTAEARYRGAGDLNGAAICLRSLGYLAKENGELQLAKDLTEKALAIHKKQGDASGQLWCIGSLGSLAMEQGDLDRARQNFEQALTIHEGIENYPGIAWNCTMLANLALRQGRPLDAIDLLTKSLRILERDKNTGLKAWPLGLLGEAQIQCGDIQSAVLAFEEVVQLGETGFFGKSEGLALLRLCELHIQQDDRKAALRYYDRAQGLLERLESAEFHEQFQMVTNLLLTSVKTESRRVESFGN